MRKIPGNRLEAAKAVEILREKANKSMDSDKQWSLGGHCLGVMQVVMKENSQIK